ncbi:MAG: AAA family ATPase [Alphaproteobacteria bacterium]
MTDEELEKSLKVMCEEVTGQQQVIDQLLASPLKRTRETANIVLAGQPGVGKTAIMKQLGEQIAAQGLADRFKDIIVFNPLSPTEVKKLTDTMIDKHPNVPADRKGEAKTIVQEMLDQGLYDEERGMRSLRPLIKAIADVSSAPDMREALTSKYPALMNRASIKSGERLAEAFTNGTADRTQALRPYRLKSRGVGFFSLN